MKNQSILTIGAVLLFVTVNISCKKDNNVVAATSALTIVNSVVGSSNLATNFKGGSSLQYYSTAKQIPYGSFAEFGGYNGLVPLALYNIDDTTHALYNNRLNLVNGSIQSLFLTGTLTSPEIFLTVDNPPTHKITDSTLGIRFVNLSPGSDPVSVNIQGNPNSLEVSNLAYRSITAFKNYAANRQVSNYIFEFRDAATGNLLASYKISGINNGVVNTRTNTFRWKNFTLALYDVPGNQNTFLINNY